MQGGKAVLAPVAAALAGQSDEAEAGPISRGGRTILEAWHGSPHKFDKFSMDAIGTGEGAQAYGHGLYFADAEDVARGYKEKLQNIGGNTDDDVIGRILEAVDGDVDAAVKELRRRGDTLMSGDDPSKAKRFYQMAMKTQGGFDPRGALYRTEIDIDPDTLLDWDKPLSEQSEAVKRAFVEKAAEKDPYIMDLWESGQLDPFNPEVINSPYRSGRAALTEALGDMTTQERSAYLNSKGIPGIRYLDGMSRGDGGGSRNYVMFDDKPIRIVERGNATPEAMAAAAIPGAVGAYAQRRQQQKANLLRSYMENNPLTTMAVGLLAQVDWSDLDMPTQGTYGLVAALRELFQGEGIEDALMQGARIAQQPVEQTAQQVGDAVFEATESPELATGAYTATNIWGPM